MTALIFGTGAVGNVYGYTLFKASIAVTAVCRSNYSAVSENGITIKSGLWGEVHYKPTTVQTVEEAQAHGPFDFVLVCSKAFPGVAEKIKAAVSQDTAIILAQNEISIEEEYEALFPNNAIISAIVRLPKTSVGPGMIEMGALERFEIGTYPANAPASHKAKVQQLSR